MFLHLFVKQYMTYNGTSFTQQVHFQNTNIFSSMIALFSLISAITLLKAYTTITMWNQMQEDTNNKVGKT